jgi:hypothetical protein
VTVVKAGHWEMADLPLLKASENNLNAMGSAQVAAVRQVINSMEPAR